MISTSGRDQVDWTADYRLFSRSPWNPEDLFIPVIRRMIPMIEGRYLPIALDETKISRPGSKVRQATWLRDPLSPPFHTNLMKGLRFLQFSALLPLHRKVPVAARGIPVQFDHVEVVKKPGKKGTKAQWAQYHSDRKITNLSTAAVTSIKAIRETYDHQGGRSKELVLAADGAFCNRTIFKAEFDRTIIIARTRKDASLCLPAAAGSRRVYDPKRFTPESVRKDEQIPWKEINIFHGGRMRVVYYKDLPEVLWQRGAGRRPLRLIVLAPTPYRTSRKSRTFYRAPAYLLCTDTQVPIKELIQPYFDRWQIEVNHRDEKQVLGLGDAQVWAEKSVTRQPTFVVASYSALLLAGLYAYGPYRAKAYEILPAWRNPAQRPSCLDLVTQLRKEAIASPDKLLDFGIVLAQNAITRKGAA